MHRRLVRKLDLEMLLRQVAPHPSPTPRLEQYTIPADVAATILYIAAYAHNDIIGKTVLDLGCGTGRLGLGAAFLGAKQVVGVDIDRIAVRTAFENTEKIGLKNKIQWILSDIDVIHGKFDTILQNPPFGVQKPKADRKFLKKALQVGKSIYSVHKHPYRNRNLIKRLKANGNHTIPVSSSKFIKRFIRRYNGQVRSVYAILMVIPHMFNFHRKPKHEFIVDLHVLERK